MPEREDRSYPATIMLAVMLLVLWLGFDFDIQMAIAALDQGICILMDREPSNDTRTAASLIMWSGLIGWSVVVVIEWISGGRITVH